MTRWLLVLMLASCAKKSDAPAAPPPDDHPKPTMTEAEANRGRDACKAYVDKVCKCALDGAVKTIKDRIAKRHEADPKGSDIVVELPSVGSGDAAEEVANIVAKAKLKMADLSEPIQQCQLSRALPEALRVAREVSLTASSTAKDIAQAEDSARKTIRGCFEDLAKLPELGCR